MFRRNKIFIFAAIFISVLALTIGLALSQLPVELKPQPSESLPESNSDTGLATPAVLDLPFKNPTIAYYNLNSDSLNLNSLAQNGEVEFSSDDYKGIKRVDGKSFTIESSRKFPYQRFDITLKDDLTYARQIRITWHGSVNRVPELYAWNYESSQWSRLSSGIGREKGYLSLTASVDTQTMVKDKTIHLLAGAASKKEILLPGRVPEADEYDFTFAWMTDTQYYSSTFPHIFEKMTRFIADNKNKKKITYGIHTGDIVDDMLTMDQWKAADHALGILDKAQVPYGVLAGNHDVAFDKADYSNYFKYFGEKRFSGKPTYGGSPDNNRNHFDLVTSHGMDFVVLYFGWKIDNQTIEWANQILKKYPGHKAIIGIHSYIATRGGYMDQGQLVFDKVVKPNENVFMVLCGHFFGTASYVKKVGNRTVYELFWNVQTGPEGGSGFFRMFHIDAKNQLLYVNTYSPYTNKYNIFAPEKDEFILPLTPETGNISIGTGYIHAEAVN